MITQDKNLTVKEINASLRILKQWKDYWGAGFLADTEDTFKYDLHDEQILSEIPGSIMKQYG